MSEVLKGAKARVYINGKLVFESEDVCWEPAPIGTVWDEVVEYFPSKWPLYRCQACGEEWTFSTTKNCFCGSQDVLELNGADEDSK